MCLKIENQKIKIAEEDIIVYKNVIIDLDTNEMYSSYIGASYKLDKLYNSRLVFASEHIIEVGIHSFKKEKDSKKEAAKWNEYNNPQPGSVKIEHSKEFAVKCIIPKGSEYIEGTFFTNKEGTPSFASTQIILKELK